MELFIQLLDGQPFEHPIFAENFRAAFPNLDMDNLPPEFSRFTRVAPPKIGVYEVYEGVTYERNVNDFTDVHHVRQMTESEKISKQNKVKAQWAKIGFASWIFDDAICSFVPPVAYPNNDKKYQWDESTTSWIEIEPK